MKPIGYFFIAICVMLFYHMISAPAIVSAQESGTADQQQVVIPQEPAGSDLSLLHYNTVLHSNRWIQSFTKDSQYYYFLQETNPTYGHLRLTRVRYAGVGEYTSEHMDLLYFGHGTNLDVSVYNGVTYLWTGSDAKTKSDVSTTISCFQFVPNGVLKKHGPIVYKIRMGSKGKRMTNVYPAVTSTSKILCVRFTYGGKQYYQFYTLTNGIKINTRKVRKQVVLKTTAGEFQGFDVKKSTIYTLEGSPSATFLAGYDRKRTAYPTVIRAYDYRTKKAAKQVIKGAAYLTFREPEGIEVSSSGAMQIMYVDGTLTAQNCNIYNVNSTMIFSKKTKYR